MSNVNAMLEQRLKKGSSSSKMTEMGRQSVQGHLTSFSGVFSISDLNEKEKEFLSSILKEFSVGQEDHSTDLNALIAITSEVKAINNQAAILHGERIKKAHTILTRYRDGAFTSWLIAAYGNRQTPYNFLQYYEFYENLPKLLRPKLEAMPRQAVYTLASREGPLTLKQKIVESYNGETKAAVLETIREFFPLDAKDKRGANRAEILIQTLLKVKSGLDRKRLPLTKSQKQNIYAILDEIREIVAS